MTPPFHVGQRVRMTAKGRRYCPTVRSWIGTIIKFVPDTINHAGYVVVRRDGYTPGNRSSYPPDWWEPIPPGDLSLDDTATALARAVLAGDTSAATLLADRVFELARPPSQSEGVSGE